MTTQNLQKKTYFQFAAEQFLIYNPFSKKCITVITGPILNGEECDETSPNQQWYWTTAKQLRNVLTGECLSIPEDAVNWDKPHLGTCDASDRKQIWTCFEELVRVEGETLNLNYGNTKPGYKDRVALFDGTGSWSQWTLYGRTKNICTKQIGMYIVKYVALIRRFAHISVNVLVWKGGGGDFL